jgi:type I restriction enzyme, R subunit
VQLESALNIREVIRKASGESLDLKAYEADMRHLIDTYIEAREPRTISPFENIGLLDLIVKSGIANAIAAQLASVKGDKRAVAETIENNVRRKIIKEHLTDPAFYESMSTLLDEIIADRKARAIDYEEYLKRIALLVRSVEVGHAEGIPATLNTPGKRALYRNLKPFELKVAEEPDGQDGPADPNLEIALRIDEAIKKVRPDDWRGVKPREQVIKAALHQLLHDDVEVERIFLIIKAQGEY